MTINDLLKNMFSSLGYVKSTLAEGLNKDDDSVKSYPAGCNATIISKTTTVTIGAGGASDTRLNGIIIAKALTGTCVITGFADSDGAAKSITLPAATIAGIYHFDGALNLAGALTVTCSNAADDDNVIVKWNAV